MTHVRQKKRMLNSFPDSALSASVYLHRGGKSFSMPFVRRFAIVAQQTSRKSSDYLNVGK